MGIEDYKSVAKMGENIMIRELRERLGYNKNKKSQVKIKTPVKVYDSEVSCIFCDSEDNIYRYMGKHICYDCYRELMDRV